MALARKGDFRGAEQIYGAEAAYLLSDDRKQQIADIYLDFADAYFKPPKEDQKPQYDKALEFYRKALEVGPKAERRDRGRVARGRMPQNMGRTGEAAALYQQFSKDHGDESAGHRGPLSPGRVPAGRGQRSARPAAYGRTCWRNIAKPVRSERVAEAQFNLAKTWQIPQPTTDEELSLGTAALEDFIERFPSAQAGQPGPPGHRPELHLTRPLRQRGGRTEPFPGRSALPRMP